MGSRDHRTRTTGRFWRPLFLLLLCAGLVASVPPAGAEDDDPASSADEAPDPGDEDAKDRTTRTKLEFSGDARFKDLGSLGQQDFRFRLKIKNPTETAIEIHSANLLLAHLGGWLVALDPDSVDGSFFRGPLTIPPGEEIDGAGNRYRSITPATHALLVVQAEDGHAERPFAIVRAAHEAPKDYEAPYPFGVGLAGPLHVLPFSDGNSSILVMGQHQVLSGAEPQDVETSLLVGSDAGSGDPLSWKGLDARGDLTALWPFARLVPALDGLESGYLRVTTTAVLDGQKETFTGTWPVTRIQPISLRAPLLGKWQLSNGPGRAKLESQETKPQDRYAYDMVVVKQGRTHSGGPHKNESYYAFGRSIYAVADGEVVDVCDHEPDNPGYRPTLQQCYNNRVVLKHAGGPDGYYSAYLHVQQRSCPRTLIEGSRVRAGQFIGKVGNSGNSSEPHLHFIVFRVDKTGRIRPAPVAFTNAYHDAAGKKPVTGVPLSDRSYYFTKR